MRDKFNNNQSHLPRKQNLKEQQDKKKLSNIKSLIKDYKIRLKAYTKIQNNFNDTNGLMETINYHVVCEKISCYRSIISELEIAIK